MRIKIPLFYDFIRISSNNYILKTTYEHHWIPSNIQVEFHNNQLYYFYQKTLLKDSFKKGNPFSIDFKQLIP